MLSDSQYRPGAPKGSKSGRKRLPKDDRVAIGDRLRTFIRHLPKSTQAALAKKAGLAPSTLTGWLSDAEHMRTPDTYQLIALANATGISLDWLLRGKGEMMLATSRRAAHERALRELVDSALANGDCTELELLTLLTPGTKRRLLERLYCAFNTQLELARRRASRIPRPRFSVARLQQQGHL
jgi:transcriptional regulator with XRE-family HTH domain